MEGERYTAQSLPYTLKNSKYPRQFKRQQIGVSKQDGKKIGKKKTLNPARVVPGAVGSKEIRKRNIRTGSISVRVSGRKASAERRPMIKHTPKRPRP